MVTTTSRLRSPRLTRAARFGSLGLLLTVLTAAAPPDPTATALDRCLNRAENASTAGQTQCEGAAVKAYDKRMNAAYAGLMRRLPPLAAQKLRLAQRTWLVFRAAEGKARSAVYGTRQGTMYVPMEADSEMVIIRDRALQLEGYLSVMRIEN